MKKKLTSFSNADAGSPTGVGETDGNVEHKQAEEALRQSEERHRLTTEALNGLLYDWDLARGVVTRSVGLKELIGFDPAEADPDPKWWDDRIHPEDRQAFMPRIRETLEGRAPTVETEYRVRHRDGHWVWVSDKSRVLYDDGGKVRRVIGSTVNITERKRAEEALRDSEERFARAFNASPLALTISSLKTGKLIEVNETFVTLSGYAREEAIGRTPVELGLWAKPQEREEAMKMLMQHGRVSNAEHGFRMRNGQERVGLVSAELVETGGEPCVLTVLADITERKQAEEALRESEERFARFMQHLPGLAWIKDLEGRYIFANDGAERMWRKSRAELHGRRDEQIFSREDAAHFRDTDQEALASGAVVETVETTEFKDGLHHSIVRKFPIPGSDDAPALIGGVAIDITERIQAERALREADRRKDEFLATLAHELRNPLAPIRTGLQIMRLAKDDPEVVEQAHTMMERQLQQMVHLIDDLLDLSRISRGKIELRKERVDLSVVIRNAIETSRPLIEGAHHEFAVNLPPEPIFVDADVTRLAQVFANLLNNAAKYTDKGGHIRLIAKWSREEVVVSVKDNGIGIPTDMLSQVFEMFAQVDRSLEKSRGGLGIGLSIAKRLVEMHGGAIEARSDGPGTGSEFVVRLPFPVPPIRELRQSSRKEEAIPSIRHRILVADDNEDSAAAMAIMLKLLGNEVRTANNGREAVKAAEEFRPELILLDIGMPEMNGYDACRQIRQQPWGKEIIISALTGWGQEEDKRLSFEAGFDHHLVKPVEAESLAKLLEGLHGNRK